MEDSAERDVELEFLIHVAEHLIARLDLGGDVASQQMAHEARDLVVALRGWLSGCPDEVRQAATKKRLYELLQHVMAARPVSSRPFGRK